MSNKFALAALIGILLVFGWLFIQILRPFLTSLFGAAVLAVLFRPSFERLTKALGDRRRLAALITSGVIVLVILLPIGGGLILAGREMVELGRELTSDAETPRTSQLGQIVARMKDSWPGQLYDQAVGRLNPNQQERVNTAAVDATTGILKDLSEKTIGFVANVFAASVGLAVMVLALYYFFADGEHFIAQLEYFSPLRYEEDMVLWRQFERTSRSVVLGTIVAGLAQAVLAGIGFLVAGMERVWLLAALTWLASLLPFVGAASVWGFVCIGLLFDQQFTSAGILAVYGTVVISGSDNLIRAYVIGGEAKLHPLIVLVSVLGAINFMGLWGIFVGPMIAAIFYSLLKIARKRLPETPPAAGPPAAAPLPRETLPTVPQEADPETLYLV